jgi:DNA (cytosine-5)-methyltransferase 1
VLTCGGLFDGIGLLAYGLCRAGIEHRWLCEADPWRRDILAKRWPGVPVYDDVRHVGADAEPVHLVAGGFPCKGASTAGKRNGFEHPETVLWREMARAVGELRPRYVLVENVANILALHDGAVWGEVLGDLAALGYDVTWDCLPAGAVGAPHLRDRVFAVAAHAEAQRRAAPEPAVQQPGLEPLPRGGGPAAPDADGPRELRDAGQRREPHRRTHARGSREAPADPRGRGRREGERELRTRQPDAERGVAVDWAAFSPAIARWEAVAGPAPEPLVRRVDDRGAARVERSRLSALGDGVQVQVGELVGRHIIELEERRVNALAPTRNEQED